ncbi:hypothetical protein MKW94_028206 [Papaver nudicaule]|uniref:Negative regulator of systemic acquired resistance SNI1 n=1 Tax=Papaver nudicaule TaxID=74823 RepID=A0AA42ASE5_PAPNU|nr:hypothetical protein [Papaver nudicaule]
MGKNNIEENTLAFIDSYGIKKEARDIEDDELTFLEAIRVTSIVPENGHVPTSKMFEAIFNILRNGTTIELIMKSFKLLIELDKRYPRVYVSNSELVVDKEAWSPFSFGLEGAYSDKNSTKGDLDEPLNPNEFYLLTQRIAQAADTGSKLSGIKPLADMFLFQYLTKILERDFVPRNSLFKGSPKWSILRESLINMLMGSRSINYKSLYKDCLSILCKGSHAGFDIVDGESAANSSTQASGGVVGPIILSELGKETFVAVQKLWTLVLELEVSKKQADLLGETSRADGVRVPLIDVIVDELTYDKDLISPFLQDFSDSHWKLEIILQYFQKYVPKTSAQTRRENNAPEVSKFDGVLKCFSDMASTRSVVKKINVEIAQLLLAHAFQAYLSPILPAEHNYKSYGKAADSSLIQTCEDITSAFQNLRNIDEDMDMLPLGEEALFTAAIILSTK